MRKSICIIVRKAPYGSMDAAEALRHINGALAAGMETRALLTGDGVYVGVKDQEAAAAGWTSLAEALEQAITAGARLQEGSRNLAVAYAHGPSLSERGLAPDRLVAGIRPVSGAETAGLVAGSDSVLLF